MAGHSSTRSATVTSGLAATVLAIPATLTTASPVQGVRGGITGLAEECPGITGITSADGTSV
ncbi:hypothetical protein [Streptomyces thermoviolaceus]|uniref:Uncharacterized protein n=1 Tax=Streptomyces thermoviolaceus subsp. thermoviolaceus TaxID=66860 RepID=A0ABX0Z1W1_STRTL|nr:hypothetical protein [Streptomyces thermoviolaceus]RSS06708.1 hypothetical protein EF917_07740 [Streptomyces sp. WAC00469]NJP17361.1 hypothetical protein [Streptomyces thermoviolaceus subsp. thermoviolaceus]WTD46160.1 hypothetical protein OG899_00695 [Streptomyces thermoviolaceus]GGV65296.1 hypothetical protein GCM10010499_09410 [Streptomyces thermoviolaceus subsp. apingens]GHA74946.1 hypothetical protein GCM10010512_01520 [Streptomyces thermoviolaceus subsp. thermoviolaceus]